MVLNVHIDSAGGLPVVAEIQIHLQSIFQLVKPHLHLSEVRRAASIEALLADNRELLERLDAEFSRGGGHALTVGVGSASVHPEPEEQASVGDEDKKERQTEDEQEALVSIPMSDEVGLSHSRTEAFAGCETPAPAAPSTPRA